ncbi:HNH endonuclease [Pseudomonas sp. DY-1]|uniref:HNH endonuclease signature motif containing protein n=1 Tax=Pseudomonas sp. DY-1 TaxID=1755504 RepID=UPI000EAAB70B|nr:HNH endonuclease [Pseudomonas sp. DY-1]
MPIAPRSVCSFSGCFRLANPGKSRCAEHHAEWEERRAEQQKLAHREYNKRRPASDKFYWTNTWKKKSEEYRARHPLCEECEQIGLVEQSQLVDHIIPYRERPDLGLVDENLRALCWPCHNRIGEKVREKYGGTAERVDAPPARWPRIG